MPESYKVGIKTALDLDWVYNELRFKFYADAQAYGIRLKFHWPQVRETFVCCCDEPANATFPPPSDRYVTNLRTTHEERQQHDS